LDVNLQQTKMQMGIQVLVTGENLSAVSAADPFSSNLELVSGALWRV
jgi:hypothetical protein